MLTRAKNKSILSTYLYCGMIGKEMARAPIPTRTIFILHDLLVCVLCVLCVVCVLATLGITWQPTGVTWSNTHGRIALNKENRFHMCLEPPGMFNKAKNTNVNIIGKTYLIILGVLKTLIYATYLP